ncbi:glycoside hydrolase, partial [Aspergillus uvarum CBS 121591]
MVSQFVTVLAAVSAVTPFVSAFDPQSRSNVAVYYGQGTDQQRLSHFCQDTSLDIINLGFVNIFPDQGVAGWPGSNFGNQCDGTYYTVGNLTTELLKGCHQLVEDIPICQAAGKKVFLSLGGAYPATQQILSEDSANDFADFLWGVFGPKTDDWVSNNGPRPFGDVVVDGFDFDIEHNGDYGYATMVNRLRYHYSLQQGRDFYISGAPQCSIPDKQLDNAIANAHFDFIWVQFYNTQGCSARDYVEGTVDGFNFDKWVDVIKAGGNPDAKLYVGLPGSTSAAASPDYYITPVEAYALVAEYMARFPDTFGGIMVWEATYSDENKFGDDSFADVMKQIVVTLDPTPPQTSTAVPSSSTPTPSPSYTATSTPAVSTLSVSSITSTVSTPSAVST